MRKTIMAFALCVAIALCVPSLAQSSADVPADGIYTVGVSSSARMFRVVRCVLQVEEGAMTATLTMSGSGYGYLFPGTAEEATAAPVGMWIPCREDAEGRHVFTMPLPALNVEMAVAAYSTKYDKWYDRTLVFEADTLRQYSQTVQDGVYQGAISSDTSLNGANCVLTASGGQMTASVEVGDGVEALELDSQRYEAEAGVCVIPLSSLDARVPAIIHLRNGEQSGWIKLASDELTIQSVRVENGVYSASVQTDSNLLRFRACRLEITDNGMTATLTAAQNSFDYIYMGSAEQARQDEAGRVAASPDESGAYTYTVALSMLDSDLPVATYSAQRNMWYDRTLRVDSASLVPLEDSEPDAANMPDSFSFTGGTGRVQIACRSIRVGEDGQTYATIAFSSPNYSMVRVGDRQYSCACDERSSTVEIPVNVNQGTVIYGTTTAMSAAHEVEYTLYVEVASSATDIVQISGLTWESSMNPIYAEGFSVDYYAGGYALIDVRDSGRYLVVPEGMNVPETLDPAITVLQQPLENVYLAATSAMALFDALDALDMIRFCGTDADGWYIENAWAAMQRGDILFAGKYSGPDFELLLNENCDLAIESTMISHSPKVQELLELLGIPVFVDRSSYEQHPLGRTEWIRLYGVLADKEEQADAFFAEQAAIVDALQGYENTEKTVAFFYIHSDGSVVVRSSSDYVPSMIEIAGGRYVFADLEDPLSDRSSISITMEEFYNAAVDADYLIYNATIDQPLDFIDELLARSPLLADFKAVREGNVWCTDKYLYQATDVVARLITDIHHMLTGEEEMTFLHKLS